MELVGTRIRVEKSLHKTEYFPEYCLKEKTWFGLGKERLNWYGVCRDSTHKFSAAWWAADLLPIPRYSLEWAQTIIDYQKEYWNQYLKEAQHENSKEITYVKYP